MEKRDEQNLSCEATLATKSKVCEFCTPCLIQHDIFELDVAEESPAPDFQIHSRVAIQPFHVLLSFPSHLEDLILKTSELSPPAILEFALCAFT
eukprot:6384781-Amphidinium_carterae.1